MCTKNGHICSRAAKERKGAVLPRCVKFNGENGLIGLGRIGNKGGTKTHLATKPYWKVLTGKK
jgi:hypothetical protein